jgi:hypothetical protein
MIELSNEEKATIVNQHIKAAKTNEYNFRLSLLALQASDTPDAVIIASVQKQLDTELLKQTVLQQELDSLDATPQN